MICTYFFILICGDYSARKNNTGVRAQESVYMQDLSHPSQNSYGFYDLKVKFKAAGIELEFQNL